jgi:hypothetical protein
MFEVRSLNAWGQEARRVTPSHFGKIGRSASPDAPEITLALSDFGQPLIFGFVFQILPHRGLDLVVRRERASMMKLESPSELHLGKAHAQHPGLSKRRADPVRYLPALELCLDLSQLLVEALAR